MNKMTGFENNISAARETNSVLMPNGELFNMNGHLTRLNNNMIVMGTSGSSKTRSVVIPNLLSCVGSYIVSDPKGNLCRQYGDYLRANSYNVITIDFVHPELSDGYNPFAYLNDPDDILKLSHYLTYAGKTGCEKVDPFWDKTGELLLSSIIGYIVDYGTPYERRNVAEISRILTYIDPREVEDEDTCELDRRMEKLKEDGERYDGKTPWSYKQYQKLRRCPPRTMNSIVATIHGNIGMLDSPALNKMFARETIDFKKIGTEKTAVFVIVSDTDRSRDTLINTFYSQAMNNLCMFADDKCEGSRLPVPVRFLLDDFGTNCRIDGFENMISNIRSRNISTTIVLQSVAQLKHGFGESARTIIDNCDTIVYMGGNDLETVKEISERANKPVSVILNMPISTNWVFRRGRKPVFSQTVDVDEYLLPKVPEKAEEPVLEEADIEELVLEELAAEGSEPDRELLEEPDDFPEPQYEDFYNDGYLCSLGSAG